LHRKRSSKKGTAVQKEKMRKDEHENKKAQERIKRIYGRNKGLM
jgi:hypothetical protein